MMKKFLALLMALLMLLPAAGLATGQALLMEGVENGRRLESDISLTIPAALMEGTSEGAMVKDLLDALKYSVYFQGGEAPQLGLEIRMSDVSIFKVNGEVQEDTLYLNSNLLGEKTVAVSSSEMYPLSVRVVDLFAAMGLVAADEAAGYKALLEEVFAAASEVEIPSPEDFALTAFDVAPVVAELTGMLSITGVKAQPRNSDPAVMQITMNLSGENLSRLYAAVMTMIRQNEGFVRSVDALLAGTGVTLAQLLDAAQAEVDEIAMVLAKENPVALYLDESLTPVYATARITSADDVRYLDGSLARLTMNDMVTWSATGAYVIQGETVLAGTINVMEKNDNITATAAMEIPGMMMMDLNVAAVSREEDHIMVDEASSTLTIEVEGVTTSVTTKVQDMTVAEGENITMDRVITMQMDGQELMTVAAQYRACEPAPSLATDDVIYLARISEADFQSWFVEVVMGLQTWLMQVVQALPASVLQLVISMSM